MSPIISLHDVQDPDLKVLSHLIYEYEKGVRNLVLYTMPRRLFPLVKAKMDHREIDYFVLPVNNRENMNLFFGQKDCLTTIQSILQNKPLESLSPEEDFMLGILLGYEMCRQCQRYQKQKATLNKSTSII